MRIEAGINFFDTADVYSNGASEEVLGRALREIGVDRHDVVIATKCNGGTHDRARNRFGLSRKNVIESCDASLKRLDTDFIDLYQIHRFDSRTPIEETIDALNDLVRAGKVRYLGASSMFAWQMAKYLFTQDARHATRFVTMQNHYNLIYREEEREMNPLCADQNVGLIPWSPLARGYLARDQETLKATHAGATPTNSRRCCIGASRTSTSCSATPKRPRASASSRRRPRSRGCSANPASLRRSSAHRNLPQLEDAIAAVDVELSADDVKQLEALYEPHAVAGHA